jgi:hypothetical protein
MSRLTKKEPRREKNATIFNEWLDLYYEVDGPGNFSLVHRDKHIPQAKVQLK